jgi:hypothetical protein
VSPRQGFLVAQALGGSQRDQLGVDPVAPMTVSPARSR